MSRYKKELLLIAFALILAAPVLYHGLPLYFFMPDIQFVKAKILHVMEGSLYADPVTGFPTLHPPYYHLLLSFFSRLGISMDILLLAVSTINICLIVLFSFLVLKRVFDEKAALFSTLMIPFVFPYMGPGYILLATSFYFSLPFFLAGLWLYLKPSSSSKLDIAASILWGMAFLFSPGYLFLIGFTFLYELLFRKNRRRFAILAAGFLVTVVPFFIQSITIYNNNMGGTAAFSFWRGIPGPGWWRDFAANLLSPVEGDLTRWPTFMAAGLGLLGIIGIILTRHGHACVIIAAVAYCFTAYHFNAQYASRIQLFLSLFLVAYAIRLLMSFRVHRLATTGLILILVGAGAYCHIAKMWEISAAQNGEYIEFRDAVAELKENFNEYVESNAFVLATDYTYRTHIMPFFPVHGLIAYKSGEYFQLKTEIADEMLKDYHRLINNANIREIDHFCRKYDIRYAVAGEASDMSAPVFRTISLYWRLAYRDGHFRIYAKPRRDEVSVKPQGW
jgi:hypothetical protein